MTFPLVNGHIVVQILALTPLLGLIPLLIWYRRRMDFHACVRAGLPIPREVGRLSDADLTRIGRATRLRPVDRDRCMRDAKAPHPQVRWAASVALLANSRLDKFERIMLIHGLRRD